MTHDQPSTLYIGQSSLCEMVAHAESITEECCGFLLGYNQNKRSVRNVLPAQNVATKNRHKQFAIDPLEYLRAEKFAANSFLELIGIYHSHPNHPAIPSESDRVAAYPNFSYVILSVMQQRFESIRSWRLDETFTFIEEPIQQS